MNSVEPIEDPQGARKALTRYRVMAYVVGVLLIVLVCIGMPMKYIWGDSSVVESVGVFHGWLYMILLITAYDLGRRVHWPLKYLLLIAIAGTVPFASFYAEHKARLDVLRRLKQSATQKQATPASS